MVNRRADRELWADRRSEDLLELAARLPVPVTVIQGADDPRPWSSTDALLEALPHAQRIVLDGAGHAPWVERPEQTRAALLGALGPLLEQRSVRE